jgi:hypothetical protein
MLGGSLFDEFQVLIDVASPRVLNAGARRIPADDAPRSRAWAMAIVEAVDEALDVR